MPGLFVFLWSTGFVGAKLGLPYAEPLTFLALRYALAAVLLVAVALASRAPWPRRAAELGHYAVAGLLVHGVYLGGVYLGIRQGVEAGVSALIVSLQPLLVAAFAGLALGERVGRRAWLGLGAGLLGVTLILARKVGHRTGDAAGVRACVAALLGINPAGTLYQKRQCAGMDLRTGSVVQLAASALATGLLALLLEELDRVDGRVRPRTPLARRRPLDRRGLAPLPADPPRRRVPGRGPVFLIPPCTALIAWPLFGERLGPVELLGMALTVAGVALASRTPAR